MNAFFGIRKSIHTNPKVHKILYIYGFVMLIIMPTVHVYYNYKGFMLRLNEPVWIILPDIFYKLTLLIAVMVNLISSIVKYKKYSQLIKNLEKVDEKLNTTEETFVKYRQNIIRVLIIWSVYSFFFILSDSLTWVVAEKDFQLLISAFNIIVVHLTVISYIVEIIVVINHAKRVGEYLKLTYWANLPEACECNKFAYISEMRNLSIDKQFWSLENMPMYKLLSASEKMFNSVKLINDVYGIQVKVIRYIIYCII